MQYIRDSLKHIKQAIAVWKHWERGGGQHSLDVAAQLCGISVSRARKLVNALGRKYDPSWVSKQRYHLRRCRKCKAVLTSPFKRPDGIKLAKCCRCNTIQQFLPAELNKLELPSNVLNEKTN